MITEELITYKTAQLAKQAGCYLDTLNYFDIKGKEHKTFDLPDDIVITKRYSQSLLQRWIREVHKLSIKIDDFTANSWLKYDYNVQKLGSQDDDPTGMFDTYELALEQALQEALTLIINRKETNNEQV